MEITSLKEDHNNKQHMSSSKTSLIHSIISGWYHFLQYIFSYLHIHHSYAYSACKYWELIFSSINMQHLIRRIETAILVCKYIPTNAWDRIKMQKFHKDLDNKSLKSTQTQNNSKKQAQPSAAERSRAQPSAAERSRA